jgi:hypothetical protein
MWLEIDWHQFSTTSPYFKAQIWSVNNSGSFAVPGTMLWSSTQQTASAVYGPASNPENTLQDVSVSGLNLTAGTQYFAVVVASDLGGSSPDTFGSDVDWYSSSTATGLTDQLVSGTWETYSTGGYLPGFKILGSTPITGVPEPTTTLLLGFGLVGLAGARRKFKK